MKDVIKVTDLIEKNLFSSSELYTLLRVCNVELSDEVRAQLPDYMNDETIDEVSSEMNIPKELLDNTEIIRIVNKVTRESIGKSEEELLQMLQNELSQMKTSCGPNCSCKKTPQRLKRISATEIVVLGDVPIKGITASKENEALIVFEDFKVVPTDIPINRIVSFNEKGLNIK